MEKIIYKVEPKLDNNVPFFLIVTYSCIIIFTFIIIIYIRNESLDVGAKLGRAWEEEKELNAKKRSLRLMLEKLDSPQRLNNYALQMKLTKPRNDQIIYINDNDKSKQDEKKLEPYKSKE